MKRKSVGIVGFGNVGQELARRLAAGAIPELELVAIASRDIDKTRRLAADIAPQVAVVSLGELAERCEIVAECATAPAMDAIARATLTRGRTLVCVSAGGLVASAEIEALARSAGGRLRIANGALPALDILRAVSEDAVERVHLTSVIKPESLFAEPYAISRGFDFEARYPSEKTLVFEGTARAAAQNFPRHMNIAVSLSLAGIGFDRTTLELWVDPQLPGANNTVEIRSAVAQVVTTIQNIPSKANKKTSAIVVPSVLAALRGLVSPIVAGG